MKATLFMALSVNGFIATESGGEDFLSSENWAKFCELAREFGHFVVGRKTYEAVKKWDEDYNFDDLIGVERIVISQDRDFKLPEGYILANSPTDALAKLAGKGFKKALVAGGASINSAFIQANLLDEIILNLEPVFIGRGIPLFAPSDFEIKTELISVDKSQRGIITLRYNVSK
ncbi:dihydrofolate reductase [Candidatus Nomurabacteria bacterium]|nr:dihydrofolate reductase [Candidatus Nomurabacteria bacterium]